MPQYFHRRAWLRHLAGLTALAIAFHHAGAIARCEQRLTECLLLVTVDGLRWQEVFEGADERLINRDDGGVRDLDEVRARFWRESPDDRRRILLPFFWEVIARQGQLFGNPARQSTAVVTNGLLFSYPGYSEILCGFPDPGIDSNDKRDNPNISVLEWLHRKDAYRGRVAAFTSWDVFPFILNVRRSGLYVNAGWQDLDSIPDAALREVLNDTARDLPHYWAGVRYDVFTFRGAEQYLRTHRPRVLYVSLGETDDWCHDGRYDLYLDSAWRTDQFIGRLWRLTQELPEYKGKTSLVITTDHGRGEGRERWKSHGVAYPEADRIWIAVMGPDTPPLGERVGTTVKQSQIAATVATLLGEDFAASDRRIAPPLEGVIREH